MAEAWVNTVREIYYEGEVVAVVNECGDEGPYLHKPGQAPEEGIHLHGILKALIEALTALEAGS